MILPYEEFQLQQLRQVLTMNTGESIPSPCLQQVEGKDTLVTHQNTVFLTTFARRKNKYPESPQLQFISICLAWEKGII